ncbi:uncharacterized protein [Porites lutea]|uniref:uncharacterized protein n=1 Tax=Porites lutea TaxID=51062 RepID=UPI003CC5A30E
MDILLRVITSPCPLQLHFFNCTKVLTEVALIKTKRPVLVLLWDTHSQGSVRLFTEQAELCKRANTETTIFPVRKTSESFKNLKTLLHRTNIEDALALLLTKVGSEFIVLMNLTSRDNLNNGAVLDKFSNSLNNYQGRYADWEKSENLREIREKQEQLLRESLLSDQKKAQERKQNCDVNVTEIPATMNSRPLLDSDENLAKKIRTTRQQRIRDCNDGEGFLIKAKWGGKSNTRLFNRGAKFQEVYDWLGSIRELPLFFSIHRPLATSVIARQEMVRRNEGVFVRDLTREEARSIFGNIVDADDVDADADPASLLLEKEADAARREEKEGEKSDEERPEDEKEKAVVVIQQFFRSYLAKRRLQKDAEEEIRRERARRVPEPVDPNLGLKVVIRVNNNPIMTRYFRKEALFQEVYDWVGQERKLPLFFILQKNGKTMKHEDRVEIHSVLDVKEMGKKETSMLLSSQVSFRGNIPFEDKPSTSTVGKATAEKRKKSKDTRTTAQRKKQKRMRENTDQ